MKKISLYIFLLLVGIIGCSSEKTDSESALPEGTRKIEVVESLNGGGYTFIKGNENGNEFWIAIREMEVNVGDVYYFTGSMVMNNFESKSLDRTFETILFVDKVTETPPSNSGNISKEEAIAEIEANHSKPKVEPMTNISVAPLSDGYTVEMVNKEKSSLAGKTVKIKGIVTKYNASIMNRNWLHIQDGTSFGESIDITVTSDQSTKVGDTVIIEGTVAIDKDFGAGYFYDVIVENAKITIEENS